MFNKKRGKGTSILNEQQKRPVNLIDSWFYNTDDEQVTIPYN